MINSSKYCIPHILNISLMNIKPETFIHALEKDDIYIAIKTIVPIPRRNEDNLKY